MGLAASIRFLTHLPDRALKRLEPWLIQECERRATSGDFDEVLWAWAVAEEFLWRFGSDAERYKVLIRGDDLMDTLRKVTFYRSQYDSDPVLHSLRKELAEYRTPWEMIDRLGNLAPRRGRPRKTLN